MKGRGPASVPGGSARTVTELRDVPPISSARVRMRRAAIPLIALVVATAGCAGSSKRVAPRAVGVRPNIVFLLTDDLDVPEVAYMPHVRQLLADEGVTFRRFYVSVSLCCPSRASILRGQYSHNTGVESNGGGNGGFETAYQLGIEKSTVGTWLHSAGYRTAYIGKYLNQYPDTAPETYVPPGWDVFDSAAAGLPYTEFNYTLNENGHLVHYADKAPDYGTTVYVNAAERFIRTSADRPFFLYLNVYAPHQPATPAPADHHKFANAHAPRTPAFDPVSMAGKPPWLLVRKRFRPRGLAAIDGLYRLRLESLQAVDRGVVSLIDTLKATHELDDTYFVFSSDNGFHLGQYRLPAGKETAYETDIHVPLIVRGPNVPRHRVSDFLVGNIDLAPTFAQLAGAKVPSFVDGRSFVPLLRHPGVDAHPRNSYLVEHWKSERTETFGEGPDEPPDLDARTQRKLEHIGDEKGVPPPGDDYIPEFHGVRTEKYLYVEWAGGFRELYNTDADPYELDNIAYEPRESRLVAELHTLVAGLKTCYGAQCRRLENEPIRA